MIERHLRSGDDGRVRRLLVESYRRTGRWAGWSPDRWTGFRFSAQFEAEADRRPPTDDVRVWTRDEEVVGIVHPESPGEAWLEIHPDDPGLAPHMLDRAVERHLAGQTDGADGPLAAFADADDDLRCRALQVRGFRPLGPAEVTRRRRLQADIPPAVVPAGYTILDLRVADPEAVARVAEVTNIVFTRAGVTPAWIAREPRMRPPRRTVTVRAADGAVAAWAGVHVSRRNRYAWFEPVGTHPDHRRRGLARALLLSVLHRLRDAGFRDAFVGTGMGMEANALYDAVAMPVVRVLHRWELPRS